MQIRVGTRIFTVTPELISKPDYVVLDVRSFSVYRIAGDKIEFWGKYDDFITALTWARSLTRNKYPLGITDEVEYIS